MILKADILAYVNSTLARNETNVDEQIRSVLDELCDGYVLKGEDTSQSFTNASYFLNYPADALETEEAILSVTLMVNGLRSDPLLVLPGGWPQYLRKVSGNLAAGRSVVESICCRPPYIWLAPAPSQPGTATINYWRRANNPDSIAFSDQWTNCIKWGVTAQIAGKYGLKAYAAATYWEEKYQKEKFKQTSMAPRDTVSAR